MGFEKVKKYTGPKLVIDVNEVNNSFISLLLEEHEDRKSRVIVGVMNLTGDEEKNEDIFSADDKFFEEIFVNDDKENAKQLVLEDLSGIINEKTKESSKDFDNLVQKEEIIDRRKRRWKLITINVTNNKCQLIGCRDSKLLTELDHKMSYVNPGFEFAKTRNPRLAAWDGRVRLFENKKLLLLLFHFQ